MKDRREHYLNYIRLENVFKNLALKRFIKIQIEKSKMTISQMVELMIRRN